MAVDRSGTWWTGTEAGDLVEYLADFTSDGYPVTRTVRAACGACGGGVFTVVLDDEEGCAVRRCRGCGAEHAMLDSADHREDAALDDATCPCGGEAFDVVVGFAFYDGSDDVRWVYVGLRCVADGVLGCYADWKIDYAPTAHLFDAV